LRWVDVCGPPGVGKSTLCDADWPPRGIAPADAFPPEWGEFVECVDGLLARINTHRSIGACRSMIDRSFRKMAAVVARDDSRVYVQTGFAQRGLGIGWRMTDMGLDIEPLREFYRLMPKSVGVVLLRADVETVQARNVARGKDRSFMVPLMADSMALMAESVSPLLELDTGESVDVNRERIAAFASA
jgi:hypothetical protein